MSFEVLVCKCGCKYFHEVKRWLLDQPGCSDWMMNSNDFYLKCAYCGKFYKKDGGEYKDLGQRLEAK